MAQVIQAYPVDHLNCNKHWVQVLSLTLMVVHFLNSDDDLSCFWHRVFFFRHCSRWFGAKLPIATQPWYGSLPGTIPSGGGWCVSFARRCWWRLLRHRTALTAGELSLKSNDSIDDRLWVVRIHVTFQVVVNDCLFSRNQSPHECLTRVPCESVLRKCYANLSHKSIWQECLPRVPKGASRKSA